MEIVALDTYAANPGDLPWDSLETLGALTVHPHLREDQVNDLCRDTPVILADNVSFDAARFSALPRLRYLGLFSTGHNQVDLTAARAAGVAVTHIPDYSTPSVAQLTMALLLNLAHRVCAYDQLVRHGGWQAGQPFSYLDPPLLELSGATLGILGYGAIGSALGRLARELGMHLTGWAARRKELPALDIRWLPWEEFLGTADALSLHLPLTEETRHIIDGKALGIMKREALVVNTSRGEIVDSDALARALVEGRLGGAGVDVVGAREPPCPENPLFSAPNVIITPHIGWATRQARQRCLYEVAENLRSHLSGGKRNRLV